jgi:CBS domain-containing protein
MGDPKVQLITSEKRKAFTKHLLQDIEALDRMIANDQFERGIRRIGAEQEFCLITDQWRPAKTAMEVLEEINDPHFTTELARYNLEINLDPVELNKDCFSIMHTQLSELLNKAERVARKHGSRVLLTGILPTVSKNELEAEFMTPLPRYKMLNDVIKSMRGGDFELRLRGVDELAIKHDTVLFEGCNTSFQLHLQIDPDDFIKSYNWAQAISGPVLGVCANSPLLLGRELWSETRIALFQQSIDTRISSYALKEQQSRVTFGNNWASGSIADLFKDDLVRHKVMLSREIEEDSLSKLENGEIPKLSALNMHNGTIYKWNRPCYGITNGIPHMRIENRYIPSGPSVIDEMANFIFWVGLMIGRPPEFDDLPNKMDFRDAKLNFFKAARTGKESVMVWNNQRISVRDLVTKEFLPIAYKGLISANMDKDEIVKHLSVIEARAKSFTGAQWTINSFRRLRKTMKKDDALLSLTKGMYEHQLNNLPVHEWTELIEDPDSYVQSAHLVEHIMSTQLITINEHDLAELATKMMDWKTIRHLPVDNDQGFLTGLLTHTHIGKFKNLSPVNEDMMVKDLMVTNVLTVEPKTSIKEAILLMKANEYGCLPVTHDGHLVGIITIKDVLPFDHD